MEQSDLSAQPDCQLHSQSAPVAGRRLLAGHLLPALTLLLLAVLMRVWLAPLATRLPAGYTSERFYAAYIRERLTPRGSWHHVSMVGRRSDHTLAVTERIAFVQGNLSWATQSGQVFFENSGLYSVDRYTRANLQGYGDVDRYGQFLFPPDTRRTSYSYWDQLFLGPRQASFERVEYVDGLQLYVFRFTGVNLDETAGYIASPQVPQRYSVRTDGSGRLWIEPQSGVVVDYEEHGRSYFVQPRTGRRVAELNVWRSRYTAETRARQLELARAIRRRRSLLETRLPLGLLAGALVWSALGVRRAARLGLWSRGGRGKG